MTVCEREIKIHGRLLRIGRLDADKFIFVDDPELLLQSLRKSQARIDLFTFIQRAFDGTPKYSYPMEWDNFAALSISTFDNWWNGQIDSKTRNMVRKAQKAGLTVREVPFDDTLVRGIHAIYNESRMRQGRPFTHYGKDLQTVYQVEATYLENSIFLGAFLDTTMVGFIKLVTDDTRTQAGIMNIVSMTQYRGKAPTNLLLAQAVRSCAQRGIPCLVYSNFAYGNKERDSLSDFKQNNGFRRVNVPRYYVPFTVVGKLGFSLGLHHRFVDRLPKFLASRLRDVQKGWYRRKFESVRDTA